MKRGDIFGIDFPFSDDSGSKVRPSLVVQSDAVKSPDVILAMISGTQGDVSVLLTPSDTPGIRKPCFVRCDKLYSISRANLYGAVGTLSPAMLRKVDACLKESLAFK